MGAVVASLAHASRPFSPSATFQTSQRRAVLGTSNEGVLAKPVRPRPQHDRHSRRQLKELEMPAKLQGQVLGMRETKSDDFGFDPAQPWYVRFSVRNEGDAP